jgi:hypothetical protein
VADRSSTGKSDTIDTDAERSKQGRPAASQWLVPTQIELGILYFLLGIYVTTATDAVIPYYAWAGWVMASTLAVFLYMFLRGISFACLLLSKQAKRHWARWVQLAFIGALVFIIFGTNLDLALRVKLSEHELNQEVEALLRVSPENQGKFLYNSPSPRGLFSARTRRIESEIGCIWFETGSGAPVGGSAQSVYGGIVYCEDGTPPEQGESTYEHLYGPWWLWLQDM